MAVVELGGMGILARLTNQCGWPGRLMTIFAALSLLSMPVDYKGGAELAHAHGMFQLWLPGGHAEIDFQNHHYVRQTDRADADGHRSEESTNSRTSNSTPDRPTISEMSSSAEKASGIASLLLLAVLVIFAARRSPSWWHTSGLIGHVPAPELPPPRNFSSAST